MDINQTVDYVANLAKLNYSEEEKADFAPKFENILNYVGALESLNLDGLEPLSRISDEKITLRKDEIKESIPIQDALKNAPKHNQTFFKVPKSL